MQEQPILQEGRVRVLVRTRPLNGSEKERNDIPCVRMADDGRQLQVILTIRSSYKTVFLLRL